MKLKRNIGYKGVTAYKMAPLPNPNVEVQGSIRMRC